MTGYNNDPEGNLIRITNARNLATSFAYDAANRLTQVTDALTQITTYGYDAVGNRTSMTDRKGVQFGYGYDNANRLVSVIGGGLNVTYTYDANGNRLTMDDAIGRTAYTYDLLDRLTRTTSPDTRSVSAAYDRAGNRVSLTNPGGVATSASYDVANRLTALTQGTLQWTFAYDGAGNRTRMTQPNGTSTEYAYLANNWLSSITHNSPVGAILQSFMYTHDANGNRTSLADPLGTTSFTYDALNRLAQAIYPAGYGTWSWTYDAVGNRSFQTSPSGSIDYAYDANNRLTRAGLVTYSYDANGNGISSSIGESGTYDPFNRLISVTGQNGTATYTYNGDGLKVRRVGPDGTTLYYHDGIRSIWETDGAGTLQADLTRDIFGNLLARRTPTARRYYHLDGLGSTTALTDDSGTVAGTVLHDAWGAVRAFTGTDNGRYLFTGAEAEGVASLYHMGARFYAPTLGRWLSEDPVKDFSPNSLNFYAYVRANPLIFTDPTGLQSCDLACLNQQRQAAASLAGDATTYRVYLELSRVFGHSETMAAMFGESQASLSTGSDILADAPRRLSIAQIQQDYRTAVRFGQAAAAFAAGGIAALVGFLATGHPVLEGVADVAGGTAFALWLYGRSIASEATASDIYWWGGGGWRSLDPSTQRWFSRLRYPNP